MKISRKRTIYGIRIAMVASMVLLVVACGAMSWASAYTIYNTDDFSLAKEYFDFQSSTSNPILKAIQMTIASWFRWGGHYFSSLLYYLLNPLVGMGAPQLSAIMVLNMALLCGSILFFTYTALHIKGYRLNSWLLVSACILWSFFDYKSWTEVVFWFAGAVDYSVELSLLLIGFALFLKGIDGNKVAYQIVSLSILFFASGGNQTIAMACFVFFITLFIYMEFLKKQRDYRIVYIIIAILIPLLNLLAPGNFARHDLLGETHVFRSLFCSLRIFVVETERLFKDSVFFVLLLAVFLWTYAQNENKDRVRLFEVISFWLVSMGVAFLACLGYDSPYLPNRTLFVVDFFLIMGFVTLAILAGERFRLSIIKIDNKRLFVVTILMIAVVVLVLMPYRIEDGSIYKLSKALVNGEIQAYYGEVSDIYQQIEQAPQEDVVIDALPAPVDGFVEIWLASDDTDYRYLGNLEVGAYYQKNIIVHTPPET